MTVPILDLTRRVWQSLAPTLRYAASLVLSHQIPRILDQEKLSLVRNQGMIPLLAPIRALVPSTAQILVPSQ